MTWKPTQAAREKSNQKDPLSQLILMTIATYCDDEGTMDKAKFTPNYKTIAERCKCSVSQLKSRIPELIASGDLIHRVDGKGRGARNRFTINLPMPTLEEINMDDKFGDLPDVEQINFRLDRIESAFQEITSTLKELKESINESKQINGLNGLSNGLNGLSNGLNGLMVSRVDKGNNNNNNNNKEQSSNDDIILSNDASVSQSSLNLSLDDKEEIKPLKVDSNHPAIKAIQHIQKRYPKKDMYDTCARVLGEHPNIEVLIHVSDLWNLSTTKDGKPYYSGNIAGKLEWYEKAMKSNSPLLWKPDQSNDWQSKSNTGWN